MLSLITRRALHSTLSSVWGRSTIRNTPTTRNRDHGYVTRFATGMLCSQKLDDPRNTIKIEDLYEEILSYLKKMPIEAQNELRSKMETNDHPQKDVGVRMLSYIVDKFNQMIQKEVGPYLSLEVKDFNSSPSQELQRYWSDKSLDEITKKLKEHETNPLLREVLEKKGMILEELLYACEGLSEGLATGFRDIF